jgi:cytochrome b6-f complex iron-sulfur subunit
MADPIEPRRGCARRCPRPVCRRRVLEAMAAGASVVTVAGILTPIAFYVFPPGGKQRGPGGPVLVAKADEIAVGQAKAAMFGADPVLIIRGRGGWAAFRSTCPHLGCIVRWDAGRGGMICPCHGALFDSRGQVLSGPSPGPLAQVPVRQVGDRIYVGEA